MSSSIIRLLPKVNGMFLWLRPLPRWLAFKQEWTATYIDERQAKRFHMGEYAFAYGHALYPFY